MTWIKACPLEKIPVGGTLALNLNAQPVLLCRLTDQEVYAVADICTHDEAPLGDAIFAEGQIECPRHGARFDVRTGAVVRLPAATGLATYSARVDQQGWIEVDLEEEE